MPRRTLRSEPETSKFQRNSRFDWLVCGALALAVLAIYAQTVGFHFVNFDDPEYISGNPHVRSGLSTANVGWALTSTESANWFPLTRLSHLADVSFFGMNPGPQHLVNLLLHAVAAMVLFAFLRRATGARWPSAFVAAVFAVHPLHVESVAWLSERKDVLCAVFWFFSLWAYVRWTQEGRGLWYGVSLAAFCCGWAAKPMIVTLPVLLLLVDVWPLRRGLRIAEKVPFFAISAAGAAITLAAQSGSGAVQSVQAFPWSVRIENAVLSYGMYLVKAVWPSGLAVFYPYALPLEVWKVGAAASAVVAVSLFSLRWARTRPWLAVGWWWFAISLLPVIGLVQVGAQARADRYMYVPMVGLAMMLAFSFEWRRATAVAAGVSLLALTIAASAQTAYWRDSGTLFEHALAVTRNNAVAEHNLGAYLLDDPGRLSDAVAHLERAVAFSPDNARAQSDLGSALSRVPGRRQEAIEHLRAAVRLQPGAAIPHNNLGNALAEDGRIPEATSEFQAALQLDPGYADARANLQKVQEGGESAEMHYNRGISMSAAGDPAGAIREFETALRMNPNYADAENNLGVALTQVRGRESEATAHFRAALRLQPDYADAHYNLGVALSSVPGEMPEALREFEAALKLRPDPELRALIEKLRSHAR